MQFADPDHVQIWNYLHFEFRWVFFDGSGSEDLDPGSRLIQQLLEKFNHSILKKIKWIRASLCESDHLFAFLEFLNGALGGLKDERWIRDRSPDPRIRPRTDTVKRRGTAQHRTMDLASTSGSAFRTVRHVSAFDIFFGA